MQPVEERCFQQCLFREPAAIVAVVVEVVAVVEVVEVGVVEVVAVGVVGVVSVGVAVGVVAVGFVAVAPGFEPVVLAVSLQVVQQKRWQEVPLQQGQALSGLCLQQRYRVLMYLI